jgi:hypothetical protein
VNTSKLYILPPVILLFAEKTINGDRLFDIVPDLHELVNMTPL